MQVRSSLFRQSLLVSISSKRLNYSAGWSPLRSHAPWAENRKPSSSPPTYFFSVTSTHSHVAKSKSKNKVASRGGGCPSRRACTCTRLTDPQNGHRPIWKQECSPFSSKKRLVPTSMLHSMVCLLLLLLFFREVICLPNFLSPISRPPLSFAPIKLQQFRFHHLGLSVSCQKFIIHPSSCLLSLSVRETAPCCLTRR